MFFLIRLNKGRKSRIDQIFAAICRIGQNICHNGKFHKDMTQKLEQCKVNTAFSLGNTVIVLALTSMIYRCYIETDKSNLY